LGRNWSPKLNLYHDQALVKTGPFSFFMHPVYASYFLTFGGYSLFSGNMFFLALSCLYHSLNLIRARTEEKMLQEKFGGAYESYCLHVLCRQSIVLVPIIVISCLGMIDEVSWLVIGKMPFLESGYKLWVQLSG
jgi:protein-S-isoprenylcysteine O-methyltransferase Ste14